MTHFALENLTWLAQAPEDFRVRLAAIDPGNAGAIEALYQLAQHRLSESQLTRMAKMVDRFIAENASAAPLIRLKLGVIGNVTTNLFVKPLKATGLRHGLLLDIFEADYDQMAHECLAPDSELNQSQCEIILFAIDHRNMNFGCHFGDDSATKASVSAEFAKLIHYRQAVIDAQKGGSPPVFLWQGLVAPLETVFGHLESRVTGTTAHQIDLFNSMLAEHCAQSGDIMLDLKRVAEGVGLQNWHNPVLWHMGKLNFAPAYIPLYCDHVARLLAVVKGKTKKVLVLDLDNTIWGGVIGDDGLEGISIGQGSAVGEAFLDIQRTALLLRQRGIVLAVCSKNEDSVAREPFRQLNDMLLKEEHFAAFQANWNDKASNIQAIAEHLALGIDSFVFLDDNPAERARVRQMLPEVAVPELPDDPAYYTRALLAAGYFETIGFSEEDKKRADYYAGNDDRLKLSSAMGSYDDYLKSLEMTAQFRPFDDLGRSRITQLINKTNQFNLTTKRYKETEVQEFQDNNVVFTLQVRLLDKFGDNGMISVVICQNLDPDTWDIDVWLMSCRVLKRSVENAVMNEIIRNAKEKNITTLVGRFIPTPKNGLVRDHYKKLGFTYHANDGDAELWHMNVEDYIPVDVPINIEHI